LEVLQLRQRVDWLLRKMFGRSSEKSISGQLSFDLGENGVTPNAREAPLEVDEAVRQKESVPVLENIYGMLMAAKGNHLPKSLTGKAIDYALARWDQLTIYTEHAELEIDNNPVENAIRPTAVGKKNWLFFGSAEAGQTSAIFYSLIGSCKALGIIPEEYLKEVFSALPEMTNQTAKQWTPAAWKARREKTKD
jgi:transposase